MKSLNRKRALLYKIVTLLRSMASIAIMVGGAVVNSAAFIGGNYLARVLWVVCLGVSLAYHQDSTAHSPFKKGLLSYLAC